MSSKTPPTEPRRTTVEEVRLTRNQLKKEARKKGTLVAQRKDTSGTVHPSTLKRLNKASKRMQKKAIRRFKGGINLAKAAQTEVDWTKFTNNPLDSDLVNRAKVQARDSLRESEDQFDRAIDTLEYAAALSRSKVVVPNKKELYNYTVIRKQGIIKKLK